MNEPQKLFERVPRLVPVSVNSPAGNILARAERPPAGLQGRRPLGNTLTIYRRWDI